VDRLRQKFATDGRVSLLKQGSPESTFIFQAEADVFIPNALGGCLNPTTIPLLDPNLQLICGAAVNQLENVERDGRALMQRGIPLVPDLISSRMGAVLCADESSGIVGEGDVWTERHFTKDWDLSIYNTTQLCLGLSDVYGKPPTEVAFKLASDHLAKPHPLWGNRASLIVENLVSRGWASDIRELH